MGQKSKDNSSKENTAKSFDNIVAEFGDLSCFVFALLGELYRKTERRHLATMAFRKALALNPFLFSAFQSLCDAGDCPNPKDVFKSVSPFVIRKKKKLKFASVCRWESNFGVFSQV